MYGEKQISVKIGRLALLDVMEKNRTNHRTIVEEARKGYLAAAKKQLEQLLDDVKTGKFKPLILNLELPQDHTEDYDTVIGMLKMSADVELDVQFSDYQKYVEDKWEWKHHFLLSNAGYSGTAAASIKKN